MSNKLEVVNVDHPMPGCTPDFVAVGIGADSSQMTATLLICMDGVNFYIDVETANKVIAGLTELIKQLPQVRAELALKRGGCLQ